MLFVDQKVTKKLSLKTYAVPKELTQREQVSIPEPNWLQFWVSFVPLSIFLGLLFLFFYTDDWVPLWFQGSVLILFCVFVLGSCTYFTYQISTNINGYKLTWRTTARSVFKPYILFASIALMVLSWVVVLLTYELLWFLVALGTTMLVFVVGIFGLRSAIQQLESTETDVV